MMASPRQHPGVPWQVFVHALILVFACGFFAAPAQAQQPTRFEAFGGVSFMQFDSRRLGFSDYSSVAGFDGEVSGRIFKRYGAVLDASGNYGTDLHVYNFMIGPQYSVKKSNFLISGRFLLGKARTTVSTQHTDRFGFTSIGRSYGGGLSVDYATSPRITVRLQADYLNTHTFGDGQNNVRVAAGIVYRFGKRYQKKESLDNEP